MAKFRIHSIVPTPELYTLIGVALGGAISWYVSRDQAVRATRLAQIATARSELAKDVAQFCALCTKIEYHLRCLHSEPPVVDTLVDSARQLKFLCQINLRAIAADTKKIEHLLDHAFEMAQAPSAPAEMKLACETCEDLIGRIAALAAP